MITKSQLFAMLNDKENRIGVTAHVAVYNDANGNTSLIIRQNGAPNAWLSNHKSDTALQSAFTKYNTWLNEWFTAQAEAAQARMDAGRITDITEAYEMAKSINDFLLALEEDHAEGEAVVAAIDNDIASGVAHAEALAINEALDAGLTEEWALKVGAKEISLADALGDMDTDTECAAMEVSPAMQRYTVWRDKAKQNDDRLVAWNCPACNMQLHGLYPDTDCEEWDSATLCPACDHLYFKITRLGKDGKGEVELRTL